MKRRKQRKCQNQNKISLVLLFTLMIGYTFGQTSEIDIQLKENQEGFFRPLYGRIVFRNGFNNEVITGINIENDSTGIFVIPIEKTLFLKESLELYNLKIEIKLNYHYEQVISIISESIPDKCEFIVIPVSQYELDQITKKKRKCKKK